MAEFEDYHILHAEILLDEVHPLGSFHVVPAKIVFAIKAVEHV